MGASQSALEHEANGSMAPRIDRSRSMSPLPREDDERNAFVTFTGMKSGMRDSSAVPAPRTLDYFTGQDGFSHIPLITPAFTYIDENDGLPRLSPITLAFNVIPASHPDLSQTVPETGEQTCHLNAWETGGGDTSTNSEIAIECERAGSSSKGPGFEDQSTYEGRKKRRKKRQHRHSPEEQDLDTAESINRPATPHTEPVSDSALPRQNKNKKSDTERGPDSAVGHTRNLISNPETDSLPSIAPSRKRKSGNEENSALNDSGGLNKMQSSPQLAGKVQMESPSIGRAQRKKKLLSQESLAAGSRPMLKNAQDNEPQSDLEMLHAANSARDDYPGIAIPKAGADGVRGHLVVQGRMDTAAAQSVPSLFNLSSDTHHFQNKDLFPNTRDHGLAFDAHNSMRDEEQDDVSSGTRVLQDNLTAETPGQDGRGSPQARSRSPAIKKARTEKDCASLHSFTFSETEKHHGMRHASEYVKASGLEQPSVVSDISDILPDSPDLNASRLQGRQGSSRRLLQRHSDNDLINLDCTPAGASFASTTNLSSAKGLGSNKRPKKPSKKPYSRRNEDEIGDASTNITIDDPALPAESRSMRTEVNDSGIVKLKKTRERIKEPPTADDMESGSCLSGPFTLTEERQVKEAVERFRLANDLTQTTVNHMIQGNAKVGITMQLWRQVEGACPSRRRKRLMDWCRLKFHNFIARGTWTKEQDDELLHMVREHGTQWSHIGKLIQRHRYDVRDRYKNYLICGSDLKKDYWSSEEENNLSQAVADCLSLIRSSHQPNSTDKASPTSDTLIDWSLVSEKMNRTRSRLQCQLKWAQLREQNRIGKQCASLLPSISQWRLQKARKELRKMTPHDKFLMVQAIQESGKEDDSQLEWKLIADFLSPRSFQLTTLVLCWTRLRAAIPEQESLLVGECARYLCTMYETEGAMFRTDRDSADSSREEQAIDAAVPLKKQTRKQNIKLSSFPR